MYKLRVAYLLRPKDVTNSILNVSLELSIYIISLPILLTLALSPLRPMWKFDFCGCLVKWLGVTSLAAEDFEGDGDERGFLYCMR